MLTGPYESGEQTPKRNSGYMNLSVAIPVYERYKQTYEKKREQLVRKGVTSFAGYITSTLEELMEKDEVFARYAPFMQEFGFDEGTNMIYIKDNRTSRIVGVTFKDKVLTCDIDQRDDCVHIGFAYALPQVYKVMEKLGIKPPVIRASGASG